MAGYSGLRWHGDTVVMEQKMEYIVMVNGVDTDTADNATSARLLYVERFHSCNRGDVVGLVIRCAGLQSVIEWAEKLSTVADSEATA